MTKRNTGSVRKPAKKKSPKAITAVNPSNRKLWSETVSDPQADKPVIERATSASETYPMKIVAQKLNVCLQAAYAAAHRNDFPCRWLGRLCVVNKVAFDAWFEHREDDRVWKDPLALRRLEAASRETYQPQQQSRR